MKKLIKLLFAIIILHSCNSNSELNKQFASLKSELKECDEVDLVLDNRENNSNTTIKVTDTSGINIFTELINGNNEKIDDSCEPIGDLLYKKNGQVVFVAEFSIPMEALQTNCMYVRYNLKLDTFRHKFTYRVGQLLSTLKYENNHHSEDPMPGLVK